MDLNLSIEGMHCGACVNRVAKALQTIPGVAVKGVEVGAARISYDPGSAAPEAILAALRKSGYAAREDKAA